MLNSPAWDSLPGRGREEVVANWPKRNKAGGADAALGAADGPQ